ncbi:MAG: aspartate aminotransferase family protein [Flavobacteriales bacterium]
MDIKSLFNQFQAKTTPYPIGIEVDRAEGIYIYDTSGKRYIDMIAGIAVSNLGHQHPAIVDAVKNQAEQYMHVMAYGEFYQSPQAKLAEKIASVLPKNLNTTFFVNSGTEANEAALKLAKRHTGRAEIISFKKSYHGSTHGSLSVTGNEIKKYAFRPLLPQVKFIEFNNITELNNISEKTACVIMETVQGDAGVRIPDVKFMQALKKRCSETGTLLILDEIQTGFGRTGTLFAFEQFGIVPDILTIAKAMGGGMPIGAFVSDSKIMEGLTHDPVLGHITTFGGHPVCCAAALANLEVLTSTNIISRVKHKGELLKNTINHPNIIEIRQIGLMFAVELKNEDAVTNVVLDCLKKGVIGFWFLSSKNSFRLAPPLTISEEQIIEAGNIIKESIIRYA